MVADQRGQLRTKFREFAARNRGERAHELHNRVSACPQEPLDSSKSHRVEGTDGDPGRVSRILGRNDAEGEEPGFVRQGAHQIISGREARTWTGWIAEGPVLRVRVAVPREHHEREALDVLNEIAVAAEPFDDVGKAAVVDVVGHFVAVFCVGLQAEDLRKVLLVDTLTAIPIKAANAQRLPLPRKPRGQASDLVDPHQPVVRNPDAAGSSPPEHSVLVLWERGVNCTWKLRYPRRRLAHKGQGYAVLVYKNLGLQLNPSEGKSEGVRRRSGLLDGRSRKFIRPIRACRPYKDIPRKVLTKVD